MARAVIIGGGITGTLTAKALCEAGIDVHLLEGEYLGAGSSSRTAAGIRQQFSTPGTVRGMRYAVRAYRELGEELGTPVMVQNGYLFLYDEPASWDDAVQRVAMQHREGLVEVEALGQPALRERFPWVGEQHLGGTFCPTDGFLLPHLVYNEVGRRLEELGATLWKRAPVTGGEVRGGRLVAVDTPKGRVEGDVFLDCTNAWTTRLGKLLGARTLPVEPLKRYLWFLKRAGPMSAATLAGMPLTILPSGAYCRPENPETMLLGKKHDTPPAWDFAYEDQDTIEPAYAHDGDVDAKPFELWAEVADYLPDVAEFAGIQATTAGFYATTPDHNPFLGYDPDLGGLIRLVGFSGHGAMMGPFTATVAAALVQAGEDLGAIDIDGEAVELGSFALERPFQHGEQMVI